MGKKHFTEEQIAFALRQADSGTSVAEVIRKLKQLVADLSLDFGGTGVGAVDWDDSFWDTTQTWTLFDVAGTTSGFGNLTLANDPSSWLDASGQSFSTSSRSANSFGVAQQGSDVVVQYVVVPEPAGLALVGLGLAAAGR